MPLSWRLIVSAYPAMAKGQFRGAVNLAFSKDLISLSQEIQQLSAQVDRVWTEHFSPRTQLFRMAYKGDREAMRDSRMYIQDALFHAKQMVIACSGTDANAERPE